VKNKQENLTCARSHLGEQVRQMPVVLPLITVGLSDRGVRHLLHSSEGAFIVTDANGFAIAHLYWKPQPALHDRYMTDAEAHGVAEAMPSCPTWQG
jgi:hypothetical protein